MPAEYANSSYWNERYSAIMEKAVAEEDASYEWYQDWGALRAIVAPLLVKKDPNFEILIPGCGSSRLAADIYEEGCQNITSIDSSQVVVSMMTDRYLQYEDMEFTVMDATEMEFIPNDCFNLIVDKALFDCQLTGDSNFVKVTRLVSEMYRVLKPGGSYIIVSHGSPEMRHGFLTMTEDGNTKYKWDITTKKLPKPKIAGKVEKDGDAHHYVYICKKKQ
jgi:ubiquinone/menaquinone biosynthesis C-methylase UbiE